MEELLDEETYEAFQKASKVPAPRTRRPRSKWSRFFRHRSCGSASQSRCACATLRSQLQAAAFLVHFVLSARRLASDFGFCAMPGSAQACVARAACYKIKHKICTCPEQVALRLSRVCIRCRGVGCKSVCAPRRREFRTRTRKARGIILISRLSYVRIR